MKTYTKTIVVRPDDLDDMQHVNNVRYVQWIQDVAKEHWEALAPKLLKAKYLWVVLNHNITYKNQALNKDELVLNTHVIATSGASSIRKVEMQNKSTNKLVVVSETKWCLLDSTTKKPSRIPEEIYNLFH